MKDAKIILVETTHDLMLDRTSIAEKNCLH